MKRILTSLFVLLLAAGVAFATVTKEDVKKLLAAGLSESAILDYVRANGPAVSLSADDIVELKRAGATDAVIVALQSSAAAPASGYIYDNASQPQYEEYNNYDPEYPLYYYSPYAYPPYSGDFYAPLFVYPYHRHHFYYFHPAQPRTFIRREPSVAVPQHPGHLRR